MWPAAAAHHSQRPGTHRRRRTWQSKGVAGPLLQSCACCSPCPATWRESPLPHQRPPSTQGHHSTPAMLIYTSTQDARKAMVAAAHMQTGSYVHVSQHYAHVWVQETGTDHRKHSLYHTTQTGVGGTMPKKTGKRCLTSALRIADITANGERSD